MGAGEIYAQAGQNFGNAIASIFNQYHEEHLKHDQEYAQVDMLSKLLWTDKNSGQPVINPPLDESGKPVNKDLVSPFKADVLEQYKNFNRNKAAEQQGGMDALKLLLADQFKRASQTQAPQVYDLGSGGAVVTHGGTMMRLPGTAAAKTPANVLTPEDKQIAASTASLNTLLGPTGTTASTLMNTDPSQVNYFGPDGSQLKDLATAQGTDKSIAVLPTGEKLSTGVYSKAFGHAMQIQQLQAAKAAAPAAQGKAQGGYSVGRSYAGKIYLGGDPTNRNSWQF